MDFHKALSGEGQLMGGGGGSKFCRDSFSQLNQSQIISPIPAC